VALSTALRIEEDPASEVSVLRLGARPRPQVSLSIRLGIVGLLSAALMAASSALRGWPFSNMTAEPWLFQVESGDITLRWVCLLVFYAGVAGLCWAWLRCLRAARRHELSLRSIVALFVVWTVPLFLAVPLFSGDVFVYYVDGQALARGYSPYDAGVDVLGPDPMVHMVHPVWRDTQTMYGPIFMRMAQGIAQVTDGHVVLGVLLFRAVAVASVILTGASVVSICRSLKRDPVPALAFAVLNPVTLLHLVGGAHNDATMLGLMMAGIAVGLRATSWRGRALAIGLCAAGAAFKAPAFAAIFVLAWIWAGQGSSIWTRLRTCVIGGITGIGFLQVFGMLTALGWGWTKATNVPGIAHPMLAPANSFAFAFGGPFGLVDDVSRITRPLAFLGSIVLAVWLVLRCGGSSPAERVLRAGGWALLGVAWLGPAVYPWYLVWGVVLLGVVGAGQLDRALIVMTVVVTLVVAPGGYGWLDGWTDWRRTVSSVFVVAFVLWAAWKVVHTSETWHRAIAFVRRAPWRRLRKPTLLVTEV
jgi:hypothetical protein